MSDLHNYCQHYDLCVCTPKKSTYQELEAKRDRLKAELEDAQLKLNIWKTTHAECGKRIEELNQALSKNTAELERWESGENYMSFMKDRDRYKALAERMAAAIRSNHVSELNRVYHKKKDCYLCKIMADFERETK